MTSRIGAHVRSFEFNQGVPKFVVPDNTKQALRMSAAAIPL